MLPTFHDIEIAASLLKNVTLRTPLIFSPFLSKLLNCSLFLKLENLQKASSFKARGTYIKLLSLTDSQKSTGVVAMSAGNHAQGVAYHAQNMGIPATIIMPKSTPQTKIQCTLDYGATVILEGETVKESAVVAQEFVKNHGLTLIHPYDDSKIIAGQGTIALEMLEDIPDLDMIIAPIGGGGLLAGCAISAKTLNPHIELMGVQTLTYPYLLEALGNKLDIQHNLPTLAEGIAIKSPGDLTREIIHKMVDHFALVSEEAIERAIYVLASHQKIIAEGAGAAPLAGALAEKEKLKGKKVGLIISGGNIDPRILASILLRGMIQERKMERFSIEIQDRPGTLGILTSLIGDMGANIIEITHQRLFNAASPKNTEVLITIEIQNEAHGGKIKEALQEAGFTVNSLNSF